MKTHSDWLLVRCTLILQEKTKASAKDNVELWKLGFEGKHDPLLGDGGSFFALRYFKKPAEKPGISGRVQRKWRIIRDRRGVYF